MRRRVGLSLMAAAAVPLAIASVAWACGVLATLSLNTRVAAPGQTISATGKNYSTTAGEVSIRLQGREGRVLATTTALPGNVISSTFTLPANLSPGWYVVLATQYDADGTPKSGTPGRTTIRIQGRAANASAAPAGTPWSSPPTGPATGAAGDQPTLVLGLAALLSLTMLVGGWMLVSRKGRALPAAQLGV